MRQLAVAAVHRAPVLHEVEDGLFLTGHQGVQRHPARGAVDQRADIMQTRPPTVHPIIRHAQQPRHPGVRRTGGDGIVDQLQDRLLDLGRHPGGQRAG